MTQYGYPQQPDPYAAYGQGNYRRPLPGGLKAIAIIAVIFGGFGVLIRPLINLFEVIGANDFDGRLGFYAAIALGVVAFVASVLQLVGGIGAFWLKGWARGCLIAYAALALTLAFAWAGYYLVTMTEQIRVGNEGMEQLMGHVVTSEERELQQPMYVVITIVSGLIKLIWPTVLLIVLSRATIKARFRGEVPQPQAWQGYPAPQQQPAAPSDYYGPSA